MSWSAYRSDGHQLTIANSPMARIKLSDMGYWVVFYRTVPDGPWKSTSCLCEDASDAKALAERNLREHTGELPC